MNLKSWIGRSEVVSDVVTAAPYAALSATLDGDGGRPAVGTPLPPLWHWLYFLPTPRQSALGPDGHARRGEFLPPVPLPRRMWAGSQLAFHRPLCVGDALVRTSTIDDVLEKSGRSGPLVFVKVRHEIRRADETEVALTEFHDIVYRQAPAAAAPDAAPSPPAQEVPGPAAWTRRWLPDDVLLFRYSALTFNGHRIHYDRRYATEVEGYPGLVVHGPLLATLLLELLRQALPAAVVASFEFRALRPVFDGQPLSVCGAPRADGRRVLLWVAAADGGVAMTACAVLR